MSENDLGAFLRERREAVTPAEVGLPSGSRRRTPGLRRAELATLAGISVEYLSRLEQGRDRHPSGQVLFALADALRLNLEERVHLRHLAKITGGTFACVGAEPPARTVRTTVRALLERLEPTPAYVANWVGDVLAFTSGYRRLVEPIGLLDGDPPSLLRYVFTDPRARSAYPEWECVASDRAASLRTEGPHVAELIEELTVTAGAAFVERWKAAPLLAGRTGVERMVHPEVGELLLAYETLELPDADGQSLVVYLPGDDATGTALDRLAGRHPGALRAA